MLSGKWRGNYKPRGESQQHACDKALQKYGFNECGVRPGYYLDNGEDALIMKRETGGYA